VTFLPGNHGEFPELLPEITFSVTYDADMPEPPEIHPEVGYILWVGNLNSR
jgi:hypothetical protein